MYSYYNSSYLFTGCGKPSTNDITTTAEPTTKVETTIAPTEEATTAEPTVPSTEETTEPTTTETGTETSTEGTTEEPTTAPSTEETTITPTTQAPTTQAPTTQAPTTQVPTTQAPTKPVETESVTQAPTQPVKPTEAPTKAPEPTKPVETEPTQTPTEAPTKAPEPTKPAVKLTGITATVSGTFNVGDTLKASDFTVTAKYSDGTTKTNPAGWSATPMNLSSTSNKITVTYGGFSTTVTVAAKEKPKANIITTEEGKTVNLDDYYYVERVSGHGLWYEWYGAYDDSLCVFKYCDGKWYADDTNMPIFKFTESNYKNKIVTDKILDLENFDEDELDTFDKTYFVAATCAADEMADKISPIKAGDVLSLDKHEFESQNILREMCGVPRLTWDDQMYEDMQHHAKRVCEHDFRDDANPHIVSSDYGKDDPSSNHGAWENIGGTATGLFGSWGHNSLLLTTRSTYGAVSYYKYECAYNNGNLGLFWYSKDR